MRALVLLTLLTVFTQKIVQAQIKYDNKINAYVVPKFIFNDLAKTKLREEPLLEVIQAYKSSILYTRLGYQESLKTSKFLKSELQIKDEYINKVLLHYKEFDKKYTLLTSENEKLALQVSKYEKEIKGQNNLSTLKDITIGILLAVVVYKIIQ